MLSTPVFWRNHLIGYVTDLEIDMWYQGGIWQAEQSEYLNGFYEMLSALVTVASLRDINTNLEKRIWVGLGVNEPTHLVYSFNDDRIDMKLTPSIKPENW